jgi:hypothetical protein
MLRFQLSRDVWVGFIEYSIRLQQTEKKSVESIEIQARVAHKSISLLIRLWLWLASPFLSSILVPHVLVWQCFVFHQENVEGDLYHFVFVYLSRSWSRKGHRKMALGEINLGRRKEKMFALPFCVY